MRFARALLLAALAAALVLAAGPLVSAADAGASSSTGTAAASAAPSAGAGALPDVSLDRLRSELPSRGAATAPAASPRRGVSPSARAHAHARARASRAAAASAAASARAKSAGAAAAAASSASASAGGAPARPAPARPTPTLPGAPLRGAATAAAAAAAAAAARGAAPGAPGPARTVTVAIGPENNPAAASAAAAAAAAAEAAEAAAAEASAASVPEDEQTYFASFDATALSTAWTRLGGLAREQEERINERERARRASDSAAAAANAAGRPPRDGRATLRPRFGEFRAAAAAPAPDAAAASEKTDPYAGVLLDPAAPRLSPGAATAATEEARSHMTRSNVLRPMTPQTSMELVHRQLPLLLMLPCECHLDLLMARAFAQAEAVIHKRRWKARFTFAYVPVEAQKVFELTNTYQLDTQLISVGACPEGRCPGNTKRVPVRFPRPFPAVPTNLTVSLYQECCGDSFTLEPEHVTAGGFTLKVTRNDPAGDKGWGQVLKARWATPDLPATAPGGLPAIVLDNVPMGVHSEKHRFYPPRPLWDTSPEAVQETSAALVTFLEDFQLGSLPLIVRSRPPPPARAVSLVGTPIDVVGDSFTELVLDAGRDVLLFIYSPFCGGSMAVMPLINQVAGALKGVTATMTVARMDKLQNDFPVTGIRVTHFPTIMLFPAGDYDDPDYRVYDYSDYNGSKTPHNPLKPHSHFTKDMLLKFIWEHGKRTHEWPEDLQKMIRESRPEMYTHNHDHAGHH